MQNYTRNMRQQATYWPPGINDGFGNIAPGDPETFGVRWEDKSELFRDAQGNEVMSSAVVYVPMPLELDGHMAKGEHTGTPNAAGARQIRQTGTTPNLSQNKQLSKVFL